MPTYDYDCSACGKHFEIFHSMSESAKRKCPSCGKSALVRRIGTGAALLFKGSGFYQTDYRTESYKSGAKAESPTKDSTGGDAKTPAAGAGEKPTESKKAEAKAPESKPAPRKKAKP